MFYVMTFDRFLPYFSSAILGDNRAYSDALLETGIITRKNFLKKTFQSGILNFSIKPKHPFWDAIYTGLSFNQFYISDKFKELLSKFDVAPHRFYPAVINKGKNEKEQYHFLHLLYTEEHPDEIDYTKSTFCIAPTRPITLPTLYGYFSFPSYEIAAEQYNIRLDGSPIIHQIINPIEENTLMYPYWIKDMSKFYEEEKPFCATYLMPSIEKYDLFVLPFLQDYVVSARLYEALIEHNITGVTFKEASFLKVSR
jgi:hypothetical protein